jgi:hypothetical protein
MVPPSPKSKSIKGEAEAGRQNGPQSVGQLGNVRLDLRLREGRGLVGVAHPQPSFPPRARAAISAALARRATAMAG